MALKAARDALEEERFEEAIEILEKLLDDYDTEPEVLVYLGIAYVQTEQPEKAIEVLRRAEDEVEDHCILCLFLGRALKAHGDLDDAAICLRRAVELEPSRPEAWVDLANVIYEMKDYGSTVKALEDALRHLPENVSLRALNAISYYRLGDYTTAEREWALVAQQRPESIMALANLAYMRVIQNRHSEINDIVERIGEIDSSDYRYLLLKGEMLLHKGEIEEAIKHCLKVVESHPTNIEALTRLVIAYHRLSQFEKRDKYLQLALDNMDNHTQCWRGLSDMYDKLEMQEKKLDILIHGSKVDKGSAAPWIMLAVEYKEMNRKDESENAWITSFELRDYIKLYCKSCDSHFKIPYNHRFQFNPVRTQVCPNCVAEVVMSEDIAVI
jgi:tetratricopeptide (TPR) repeat protein